MLSSHFIRAQGRSFSAAELVELQDQIDAHPNWSRYRVAQELCQRWDWRTPLGQLKTFAARSLLLTLAEEYGLRLPLVRAAFRRHPWGLRPPPNPPAAEFAHAPLPGTLESLQPLRWHLGRRGSPERERALAYLRTYHYLGCNRPVGTHLIYLVQDVAQRDLAVHLVGAAAWHCAGRDRYIGWSAAARAAGLHRIGNHSRFLILPWVQVPGLASHLLGGLTRRISADWQGQHGWRLEMLETFVETGRYPGTAYRAAHWQEVGQTTGRTRQERHHRAGAPRKSIWVYGLRRRFREHLGALSGRGGAR